MRIAILGAGGFIGSHLVQHLVTRGEHSVHALDVSDEKLAEIDRASFTFEHLDIREESARLDEAVEAADLVVDLIAHANPSLYVTTPLEVFDLNFLRNLDIANLCIRHRKRLIQYSSAEVYGKSRQGTSYSEEHTDLVLGPTSKQRWIYAAAKGLLERVIYAHGEAGHLEYTLIRPFNFIGSRFDYLVPPGSMGGPRVFAHYMSALLSDGPMFLVDGGHVHRAFLHISDGNAAFQAILDNPAASRNQIINVGNPGNDTTIRDLAHLMKSVFQEITGRASPSELVEVSGEEFYGEGYEDSDRLPPDISKMKKLGWTPTVGLRDALREAMEHYLVGVALENSP